MASHPYYPQTLILLHYVPPTGSLLYTLGITLGGIGSVILLGGLLAKRRGITFVQQVTFTWFVLCGFLHSTLELYFVLHHDSLAADNTILGLVWKEYAKSDSRYLSSDTFLWCTETFTVFIIGPLCWYTSYLTYQQKPTCHLYTVLTSTCHLITCTLYFTTSLLDGSPDCIPNVLYFWVYFVGFNLPWIIIPFYLVYNNMKYLEAILNTKVKSLKKL
ncbi:Emopamil-binding protein [Basidiobolus meristosporus CBS 931.73]|uniref:Emopamil-binding protein n=1 Tax=Basidiobolus meristosporus CBS 931.73 TaxID=1314790 RepID=A0A1Y1Z782_9FUNG|nr:Emopamil-binding protein [Basidiobolus meristosporus CBS 931.73]|eukprot:ORY05857.1 Emopamil-binding protein [Basidiobolus meristosporus CBS 931.73]